jgi:hypothetical protein
MHLPGHCETLMTLNDGNRLWITIYRRAQYFSIGCKDYLIILAFDPRWIFEREIGFLNLRNPIS